MIISKLKVDADGDLYFTRQDYGIKVEEPCCEYHVFTGFHAVSLCGQKTRLARFLFALPHLWRYTK